MLDILTIVHGFADIQTAARLRRTCRRLAVLTILPNLYTDYKLAPCYTHKYRVGDNLHRLDGPAIESEQSMSWYRGGIAHREYHPQSIDGVDKMIQYCIGGKLHREVGPSVILITTKCWNIRGILHRKTGPAYSSTGGDVWHTHGEVHRLDAPAYAGQYMVKGKCHRICGPMNYYSSECWLVNGITIRE